MLSTSSPQISHRTCIWIRIEWNVPKISCSISIHQCCSKLMFSRAKLCWVWGKTRRKEEEIQRKSPEEGLKLRDCKWTRSGVVAFVYIENSSSTRCSTFVLHFVDDAWRLISQCNAILSFRSPWFSLAAFSAFAISPLFISNTQNPSIVIAISFQLFVVAQQSVTWYCVLNTNDVCALDCDEFRIKLLSCLHKSPTATAVAPFAIYIFLTSFLSIRSLPFHPRTNMYISCSRRKADMSAKKKVFRWIVKNCTGPENNAPKHIFFLLWWVVNIIADRS